MNIDYILTAHGIGGGRKSKDNIPPPPVVGLKVVAGESGLVVTWQNPDDTDFVGVRIVRNVSAYPTSEADGDIIYDGAGQAVTDAGAPKGQHVYYRAFTYDFDGNIQTDGSQVTRGAIYDDPFAAPGPKYTVTGDMTQGYFGETSAVELISGTALASMIGLAAGTAQNNTSPWIKSAIDGKIIYWAKKPFRHTISWNQINAAGAVDGSKIITIGDHQYQVRLFRGSTTDPSVYNGAAVHGSEFNRVVLPTHEHAKTGSWRHPDNVGPDDAPNNWGIDYTDTDLVFISEAGLGSHSWVQEANAVSSTARLNRGNYGVSYSISSPSTTAAGAYGWRPVLEVVS